MRLDFHLHLSRRKNFSNVEYGPIGSIDDMHPVLTPQRIATEPFTDADAAVARLIEIYERNTRFLRDSFEAYVNGEVPSTRVRATYPLVRILISTHARLDSRLSYGFVAGPGIHETTVTRPDLFRTYLIEQITLLIENHGVPVEIGELRRADPRPFCLSTRHQCRSGVVSWRKVVRRSTSARRV